MIRDQLQKEVQLVSSEAAGDFIPYPPAKGELPADSAGYLTRFLEQASAEEIERGAELARVAIERFTGPIDGNSEQRDLVVTHNFLIAWLVRHALDAPPLRWLSLNHCNAALTVLRYAPDRPSAILLYNDMHHLPTNLQWTGFPTDLRA